MKEICRAPAGQDHVFVICLGKVQSFKFPGKAVELCAKTKYFNNRFLDKKQGAENQMSFIFELQGGYTPHAMFVSIRSFRAALSVKNAPFECCQSNFQVKDGRCPLRWPFPRPPARR